MYTAVCGDFDGFVLARSDKSAGGEEVTGPPSDAIHDGVM